MSRFVPERSKLAPFGSGKAGTPWVRMHLVKPPMVAVMKAGTLMLEAVGAVRGAGDEAEEGGDLAVERSAAISTGLQVASALR